MLTFRERIEIVDVHPFHGIGTLVLVTHTPTSPGEGDDGEETKGDPLYVVGEPLFFSLV